MENQHRMIAGYRDLTQDEIEFINDVKATAAAVGRIVDQMSISADVMSVDKRWLAIGKTHLQEGFMALVRSIAKPEGF